jgi:hypothetical protein
MMPAPTPTPTREVLLDVVIAVHAPTRRVDRAVASVLACRQARAIVVCHGVGIATIADRLREGDIDPHDPRVRLLGFQDGQRSPTGPFTYGLGAANAPWVALLGSDDTFARRALDRMLTVGETRGSDAVVAPLRQGGRRLKNPLVRPTTSWRTRPLDPVRDRLASRSAPLGILRRATVERLGLRLTEGLRTGEDLEFSARLWFSGARIDHVPSDPPYDIGTDAPDRVTSAERALADELGGVRALAAQPWVADLPTPARRALAVTMLRVHVLAALARRVHGAAAGSRVDGTPAGPVPADGGRWADDEPALLGDVARAWVALAPGALAPLSRADRDALDVVLATPAPTATDLVAAAHRRVAASRLATILPRSLAQLLDREGTLRRYVRYRLP